jgi:hypothetical protein
MLDAFSLRSYLWCWPCAFILFFGCKAQDPVAPTCIVGSGIYGFVPFDAGASIPIIHGPQGGFHIWGSALMRYMPPQGCTLHFTMRFADTGTVVSDVTGMGDLMTLDPTTLPDGGSTAQLPLQDGWEEWLGQRVFVTQPDQINGKPLVMRLEASGGGQSCVDERSFTPHQ